MFLPCPVATLFFPVSGLFCCCSAVGTIPLAIAPGDKRLMAAGALFPALSRLIFLPEDFMPYHRVQLWLQRENGGQEIIAVHSAVMDRRIGRVDHMAWPIVRQTGTVEVIGAFVPRKLLYAAQNLFIKSIHVYRTPPSFCFGCCF